MNLGVRFAIVPHLSKTYLDGGALHLDNRIDQPVIALTLRYGRIDSFWFTLMHEIVAFANHSNQQKSWKRSKQVASSVARQQKCHEKHRNNLQG